MRLKRVLGFVLALTLVFTQADLTAFAAEVEPAQVEAEVQETPKEESEEIVVSEEETAVEDASEEVTPEEPAVAEEEILTEENNLLEIEEEIAPVNNTEESPTSDFTFNGGKITAYNGAGGAVVIPKKNGETDITEIGNYAFENNATITSIVIPNSINKVGAGAFKGCSKLTSVTFEDSTDGTPELELVEETYGYGNTFANCTKLTEIKLSNKIKTIPTRFAMSSTELVTVVMGANVEEIKASAFEGATKLTTIDLNTATKLKTIGVKAFNGCANLAPVTFPNTLEEIGNYAFEGAMLGSKTQVGEITIPKSVNKIGSGAFKGCTYLGKVEFEDSTDGTPELEFVEEEYGYGNTFANCTKLTEIKLSNKIKTIPTRFAMSSTELTTVVMGANVEEIKASAFEGATKLTTIDLNTATKLKTIGVKAFNGCANLAPVTFPNTLEEIGNYAFEGAMLGSKTQVGTITIPKSVNKIGFGAFKGCTYLGKVEFEDSTDGTPELEFVEETYGHGNTFANCTKLTEIKLSNKIKTIPTRFAMSCTALTTVHMGANVLEIKASAFEGATKLTTIDLDTAANLVTIGEKAFYGCSELAPVTFPSKIDEIGKNAFANAMLGSRTQVGTITIPKSINKIGVGAFAGCTYLGEVIFENSEAVTPQELEFLEEYGSASTFASCPKLTKITLSNKIKTIPAKFTMSCETLANVLMSTTIEKIGTSAFDNDAKLTSINLETATNLVEIGSKAFYNCSSLEPVIIPSKVKTIGGSAFEGAALGTGTSLGDIVLPASLESVGTSAFKKCKYLGSITFTNVEEVLVEGLTLESSFGSYTFSECENLTTIVLSNNVKVIPKYFAYNCPKLTSLTIPTSVTEIVQYAFYVGSSFYISSSDKKIPTYLDGGSTVAASYNWAGDNRVIKTAYSVTFDANTGEGTMSNQKIANGDSVALKANAFTKTGYTFTGWNTKADGTGKTYADKAKVKDLATAGGNITLYAQWKPYTYTIIFNKNKATSGSMANQASYYEKDVKLTKNTFTRTGFTFTGWNTKADGTGDTFADEQNIKTFLPESNGQKITLYAMWEGHNITVNFAKPEGVAFDGATSKTVKFEGLFGDLPVATKTGATFIGWFYEVDGAATEITSTTQVLYDVETIDLKPYFITNEVIEKPTVSIADSATLDIGDKIYLSAKDAGTTIMYSLIDKNAADSTATLDTAYTDTITVADAHLAAPFTNGVKLVAVAKKGDLVSEKLVVSFTVNTPGYGDIENVDNSVHQDQDAIKAYIGSASNIPDGLWIYSPTTSIGYDAGAITTKNYYRLYVFYGKKLLEENKDYTLVYKNNTNVGTALVTVKGKGNYGGTLTTSFTITPISLDSSYRVTVAPKTLAANNKEQKVAPAMYFRSIVLNKNVYLSGKDYDITYVDDRAGAYKSAGEWNVKIVGKGNFTGTIQGGVEGNYGEYSALVRIEEKNSLTLASITIKNADLYGNTFYYTGEAITSNVEVKVGKTKLKENTDYTISYYKNAVAVTEIKDKGEYSFIIIGKGSYSGSTMSGITVTGKNIAKATVTCDKAVEAPASGTLSDIRSLIASKVKVYADAEKTQEIANTNYTVTSTCKTITGNYSVVITGKNDYAGTMKKFTVKVNPYDLAAHKEDASITVSVTGDTTYVKGGLTLTSDDVVVKIGATPINTAYYTVKVANGKDARLNTSTDKKGKANGPYVTITGKGAYKGSLSSDTFTIAPKNLSTLKASAKDIVYKAAGNNYKSAIAITDVNGKALANKTDYKALDITTDNWYYYTADTLVGVKSGKTIKYILRSANTKVQNNDIVPAGTMLEIKTEGTGNYTGNISAVFRVVKADIAKATIKINAQAYKGGSLEIDKSLITSAAIGKTALNKDSDFEIVAGSFKNNSKAGTASFTIRGLGNYGGTKVVSFKITAKSMNYTIKYDANGGTGKAMKNSSFANGSKLTKCGYKAPAGKVFKGWAFTSGASTPDFVAATPTAQPVFTVDYKTYPAGSEITLYAVWGTQ